MLRFLAIISLAISAVIGLPCFGQDAGSEVTAEGRIIGRIWHTHMDFGRSFEFLNHVREELEIPQSPVLMMATPGKIGMSLGGVKGGVGSSAKSNDATPDAVELKGTLLVLRTRPDINFDSPIGFQLIGTEDNFRNEVTKLSKQKGPVAELIGEGDFYEIKMDFSKFATLANAAEPSQNDAPAEDGVQQERRTISIVVTSRVDAADGLAGGAKADPPKLPSSTSTYYRYSDGVMYSCPGNLLKQIKLPTLESLKLTGEESSDDLYADFDLTEIPDNLKRVFWSALEAQASVFLQRFDEEAEGDYSLRRAISQGRLELLKTMLFDIDRARLTLNLPTDSSQQIVAKLKITARNNSPLAGTLRVLSNGSSQLTVLQDEQAPLLISSSLEIPDFLRPLGAALLDSVGMKLKQATADIAAAESLVDELIAPLKKSVTAGTMDSAICLRGTVESGLIPCAAMRIEDAESFLGAMQTFIQVKGSNSNLHLSQQRFGDYAMFSVHLEKAFIPVAGTAIPVQFNVCGTGSWVWLTVGGEPAQAMLKELVTNSNEHTSKSGQATPLLVRLRLQQWLGNTDDPISKLPQQVLNATEEFLGKATRPQMMISVNGASVDSKARTPASFTSYAAKVFEANDSSFDFRVRTAERELFADATVGIGLAKLAVAQFLHSQSEMFKGMNFQMMPTGDGKGAVRSFRIQAGTPGP